MPLSNRDLEREAEDIDRDRRIMTSTYCGGCGYNLRALPRAYNCPECGQEYNTRPQLMKGIFAPHNMEFPFFDMLATSVFVAVGAWFGYSGIKPTDPARLWVGGTMLFLGVLMGIHTWRRFRRYIHAFSILRRIEAQEASE